MPVDIRGKKYTTVAERIVDLHENTSGDYSIETDIVQFDAEVAVIKATLIIGSNRFSGHAFEKSAASQINKTSHLENCETSAIGRALAAAGYGGTEYASANEVQQAIHQQATSKPPTDDKQKLANFIGAIAEEIAGKDPAILTNLLSFYTVKAPEDIPGAKRATFFNDLKHDLREAE